MMVADETNAELIRRVREILNSSAFSPKQILELCDRLERADREAEKLRGMVAALVEAAKAYLPARAAKREAAMRACVEVLRLVPQFNLAIHVSPVTHAKNRCFECQRKEALAALDALREGRVME